MLFVLLESVPTPPTQHMHVYKSRVKFVKGKIC